MSKEDKTMHFFNNMRQYTFINTAIAKIGVYPMNIDSHCKLGNPLSTFHHRMTNTNRDKLKNTIIINYIH